MQHSRKQIFERFLDFVEREDGEVVIVGDFLELWKYRLKKVVSAHKDLLDRLSSMNVTYVLGNHDAVIESLEESEILHPFLNNASGPVFKQIDDKKFKFMHGHEVDPFIPKRSEYTWKLFGFCASICDLNSNSFAVSSDVVSDIFLEIGEYLLKSWYKITKRMDKAVHDVYQMIPNNEMALLQRPFRTHRMLTRYYKDKKEGLYDVAVVGHTHKAGKFDKWYVNSGCWTTAKNNFLRISPNGDIKIYDWCKSGPRLNNTKI